MPLVGNDVVDLAADGAAARWKDERFLRKVFTDSERESIRRDAVPEVVLWSLWACKEAAFKVVRKLDPEAGFVPRRFPVRLILPEGSLTGIGWVETAFGPIPVRVETGDGFVHSLARWGGPPGWEGIVCRILATGPPPAVSRFPHAARFASMRIRKVVRAYLSHRLGCGADRIDIVRPESKRGLGPPMVFVVGVPVAIDLSLSHDGKFLALNILNILY